MKTFKIFILLLFFLNFSCESLREAGKVLRNEKVNTTDEFLVKQKEPLELPPDYNEIPKPNSKSKERITTDQKLKKILKVPSEKSNKVINKSSSIEESILNKINK